MVHNLFASLVDLDPKSSNPALEPRASADAIDRRAQARDDLDALPAMVDDAKKGAAGLVGPEGVPKKLKPSFRQWWQSNLPASIGGHVDLNERHGTTFSREDFLRLERVNQEILEDEDLREMIRNNPEDVVRPEFEALFMGALIRMFQRDSPCPDQP
ncbi:hypothetical protein [Phaeovulum vinaykumarii]|uniref:hypothetical protein n=1 Tax=Phaeovulum vinaykumarii TaxID=407234 RepID=UPI00117A00D7|nr:hypothetical protein [Phaeovulum vinaykumarii]